MMLIKYFIVSVLILGCGKNVQIKSNQLETLQQITEADVKKYEKSGVLNTTQRTIVYQGQTFTISKYSSQQSTTFINSLPGASQIPVSFIGGFEKQEVVLESIKRQ